MSTQQPNILFVFTDQQRWDTCGCYEPSVDITPNLDAMAGRGMFIERAFTCQPVCGPARASLQTGLYAVATGVICNGRALPSEHTTLAGYLGSAGYETGYIGKWHLSGTYGEPVPRELRGRYDYWLAADTLETTSHPYEGVLYDADNKIVEFRDTYRVDFLTDRAIDFIRHKRQRPFFLFLSFLEPHHQNDYNRFVGPKGYADKYKDLRVPPDLLGHEGDWAENLPDYYGIVARIDECLGRLLDELERLGLTDETIVVFTSDHGCHFRTRNREYKRSCHDACLRIPMVLDGGPFRGAGRISQLISLVDLPPTLLAAAGLEVPQHMHGRSILPLLRGEDTDWPGEVFAQISESHVGRTIRTDRWKYSVAAPQADPVNDAGSERYVEDFLYDLQADPHEQNNLVDDPQYADVRSELRERLIQRMIAAGEQPPLIVPAGQS